MKLCTVFKNVLAKKPKIIPRNKEKGHFGPILGHFGPITQSKAIYFFYKSFKWLLMAMRMLFRGNLGKISEQIGVNLHKNAILG